MKVISRNTELVVLLLIIFFIYFTLTIMYENKIALLEESTTKESDCINEQSLYFQPNNNEYIVKVVFEKKIAVGYVKVNYEGISTILELDDTLLNSLLSNVTYVLTIEKVSNSNIIKTNLQELINVNKLVSVEQEV